MMPRLSEVSYSRENGLTLRFKPNMANLVPDDTMGHLKSANKEFLLALRSVIDHTIDRIDRPEPKPRRPRKVEVKMGSSPANEEDQGEK